MTESNTVSPIADRVRRRFREELGEDASVLCFAPGRLNLIGAHLDYSGGDVLPLALDLGVYVAARLREDSQIRLRSLDQSLAVDVDAGSVGESADSDHGWARYPLGVYREFARSHGLAQGLDVVFGGDLPMGSGLSSSAAIEVALATALRELLGLDVPWLEIAHIAHRAETDYVGVKCGIMDQFASALGRDGHALLLHCHDRVVEHVPMDSASFHILVVDTKRSRNLSATGFNTRVEECTRAREILCEAVGERTHLAAFTVAEVESAQAALGERLYRRARHVASEMGRVERAVAAMRAGDFPLVGQLISASHESTRTDYDVSCEELDLVTSTAVGLDGVFGARLTGAGFGGCAFVVLDPSRVIEVAAVVRARYEERFGLEPGHAVVRPGGGPRVLD